MPPSRRETTRAAAERAVRSRLIGGVAGMVLAIILVSVALAQRGHPHRPGLAVLVSLLLLVVLGSFNWWIYRLGLKQVQHMPDDNDSFGDPR